MKQSIKQSFLPVFLLVFLSGLYLLGFISMSSIKGSFHTDEPGIVLSSLNTTRKVYDIFKDAATIAQPPLEHIIRSKIYQPIGNNLGIALKYPELFHRFLSLLWWLLPIGYFCLNLKYYSNKRIFLILLSFLLLISSEFLRGYITEARHYSAIAATFATMIVVLLCDKLSYHQLRFRFFIVSLFPPLLHLISFPYYFALISYFFYKLYRESYQKYKAHFYDMITLYTIYLAFIVWLYFSISKVSSDWQHPNIKNVNLIYLNSRIKWTLDWIFYGTPFYFIFKLIPNFIKNNLIPVFALSSVYSILQVYKKFFKNKIIPELFQIFPIIVTLVWPLTFMAVLYRSGMFTSERYSIAILVIILFGLSSILTNFIWNLKNKTTKKIFILLAIIITLFSLFIKILPIKNFSYESNENIFIRDNVKMLINSNNILIADNGAYSLSIPILSIVNNIPLKTNYIECRNGTFYEKDGHNTINEYLKKHNKDNVYLLSTGKPITGNNKVIWKSGNSVLYSVKTIDNANLCNQDSYQTVGNCYLRCTKGQELNPDGKSIPGVSPHIDIYRN